MRTQKSTATFTKPFTLNRAIGELPAGTYEIEIDEEEILTANSSGYRRSAIYFFVQSGASTRTVMATPSELDSAIERDRNEPQHG